MEIIWIDDTTSRKDVSDILGDKIGYPIEFVDVNNVEIEPIILDILKNKNPDLFIIDHSLNLALSETIRTGSTLALMIRDRRPICPIICVTASDGEVKIDSRHRDVYELVVGEKDISKNYHHIKALVDGFHTINKLKLKNFNDLIHLLKPDEEDFEQIAEILPIELKLHFHNESIRLDFYRWVYSVLILRPGFLLDKLWVSTLIGLTEDSFERVENLFDVAIYDGIFSNKDNKRWWKSKVLEALGDLVDGSGLPWKLGRYLIPDSPNAYSKCYSSKEDYPDTVAYTDPTEDAVRVPMKTKYTLPHPLYDDTIFFEPILIMKGA